MELDYLFFMFIFSFLFYCFFLLFRFILDWFVLCEGCKKYFLPLDRTNRYCRFECWENENIKKIKKNKQKNEKTKRKTTKK